MENRELLEKQKFWEFLSENDKKLISSHINNMNCAKGSILHNNSQTCLGLVFVKSGLLRVYFISPQGREYTLYLIKPGELCVMSAACIIDEVSFDIFVCAEEDTEIAIVRAKAFKEIMEKNKDLQILMYKSMSKRFSEIMVSTQNILFYGVDTRLANCLLEMSANGEVKITQEKLAHLIGSAREVVTRMLGEFEKQGIIKTDRGKVKIIDEKKLKEISKK